MFIEMGSADNALDETVFDGGARFVELVVNGEVMSPRLTIGVVPYAVKAAVATRSETVGNLKPSDLARADHSHTGEFLPLGSSVDCPGGVVVGLNGGSGDVVCGAIPSFGALSGGGLALDANNEFFIANDGVTSARIADGAVASDDIASMPLPRSI